MTEQPVLFSKKIEVRWADCDANQHMRHSAYADFCAHTRIGYMIDIGMTPEWLKQQGLGPVLFKEETEYFRELFMGEVVDVTIEIGEPTGSAKSVQLVNSIYRQDGELAARHKAIFGWFSMSERKVVALPDIVKSHMLAHDIEPA